MLASNLPAADLFLTPDGAGRRDGSSWENAFDKSALPAAVNERLQPGDRLLVGGGEYRDVELTVKNGGKAGQPVTIEGVDRGSGFPVFSATWSEDRPTAGRTAIRLEPGVSHIVFRNLHLRGYVMCVLAPAVSNGAARTHLTFDNVDMERCRHGFYLSDCDDTVLAGCDLKRYSKHGFRLDQGCDRVTFRSCTADCSEGDPVWETKTELLPFGFTVTDGGAPNTGIVFEDCLARNNMKSNQTKKYKNGDGFVVEGNTRNVAFRRCRSIRNQDGGFDLKVPDVTLVDCVAVGNKRGFRIWTTGAMTNCVSVGGETGLWSNGGPLLAVRCTIHAAAHIAVTGDDKSTDPITVRDGIISAAPGSAEFHPTGRKVVLESTVVHGPKQADKDPSYVRSDPDWDGAGDAMDSRTFPDKGYSSKGIR